MSVSTTQSEGQSQMAPLAVGIEQAARLLGLSPHTIRAYERKSLIKGIRFGTRVLIPTAELNRIIAEGIRRDA